MTEPEHPDVAPAPPRTLHPGQDGLTSEDREWLDELTTRWVDVYKKSATTLVLLQIVRDHGPLPAARIAPLLEERTGWRLTERGLYRTLRRLAENGILQISRVDVVRTGAKRQDFAVTALGSAYLARIETALV